MTAGLILDFDGTMLVDEAFYSGGYRDALEASVTAAFGEEGRRHLGWHRDQTGHLGMLTLPFFDLGYDDFCARLLDTDLSSIATPDWRDALEELPLRTVIYTGSPRAFVLRLLDHWQIEAERFEDIVGWQPGEALPLKFSASPRMFQALLDRNGFSARLSWSLGDSWSSDLAPAKAVGMRTVAIGGQGGAPDIRCRSLLEALNQIRQETGGGA